MPCYFGAELRGTHHDESVEVPGKFLPKPAFRTYGAISGVTKSSLFSSYLPFNHRG